MIECVFTIDYELYGNGEGALGELVHQPTERLLAIFNRRNTRFVAFVEAAELEKIEVNGADPLSKEVRRQIRVMHESGFEVALHIHPQWCNARFVNGAWLLDYSEYNLCKLSDERVTDIVTQSISYLRNVLETSRFTPFSFRAGNWLLQPSKNVAKVLVDQGIRIDSSVFKGGRQHFHGLDYRRSLKNGYFWRFGDDIQRPDQNGTLTEIPIHTAMVPFWRLLTKKRVGLQRQSPVASRSGGQSLCRLLDCLRLRYPLKFDFCRMTLGEMTSIVDRVIAEDMGDPQTFRPLVAIGHTKDLHDVEAVDRFLGYLEARNIPVSTLREVYLKCGGNKIQ